MKKRGLEKLFLCACAMQEGCLCWFFLKNDACLCDREEKEEKWKKEIVW